MNITADTPEYLWLFIPLVAAAAFRLVSVLRRKAPARGDTESARRVDFSRTLRGKTVVLSIIFAVLCVSSVILALSGIAFGTREVPSARTGRVVTLVFDISYSMTARDMSGGESRLEAASRKALRLLSLLASSPEQPYVSVVLTKGDAFTAIPETKYYAGITPLLESLSPALISTEGTSLGRGIEAASADPRATRQESSARFIEGSLSRPKASTCIILFTDGEETDDTLEDALNRAVRAGARVAIIGFGSEHGTEVLAGDGVTKVRTALRTQSINEMISRVTAAPATRDAVFFVNAGDAARDSTTDAMVLRRLFGNEDGSPVRYETQLADRHTLFIGFAILFFVCALVLRSGFAHRLLVRISSLSVVIIPTAILLISCSPRRDDGREILEGRADWNRGNYQSAVASFLTAETRSRERGDNETRQYANFGLAVTYLAQGESEMALSRLKEAYSYSQFPAQTTSPLAGQDDACTDISLNGTDNYLRFAVLYNSGIIAYQAGNYDEATDYFKRALILNNESTDAKINLELSLAQQSMLESLQRLKDARPSQGLDSTAVDSLYLSIKEDEKKQWKSSQQSVSSSSLDY